MNKVKFFFCTTRDPSGYFNTEVEKWQNEYNVEIISTTTIVVGSNSYSWLLTVVYKKCEAK